MSTYVMADCWPLKMQSSAKSVLIALADQANDQYVCWPSISTLMIRTCLSERAVRNALRSLEEMNLIETLERRGTSSSYTITPQHFGGPRQEMLPGISRPPARRAPPSGTSCPSPRQQVPHPPAPGAPKPTKNLQRTTNEPDGAAGAVKDLATAEHMVSTCAGLTTEAAVDYLAHRKRKKSPLSIRAWRDIAKEIEKSGWPPDDAISKAMNRGWVGLEASWLAKEERGHGKPNFSAGGSPRGTIADRARAANNIEPVGRVLENG